MANFCHCLISMGSSNRSLCPTDCSPVASRPAVDGPRPVATGPVGRRGRRSASPSPLVDHLPDGAAAPTRQPHPLASDELVAYPARGRGVLSVRWLGGNLRAHYLAPDGRAPPAKTQGCTAVSARLLIRMRSQVQVLAGPPPIVAGHSATGSELGALAAGLGRAGAARPPPPAPLLAPPGAARPSVSLGDDHIAWSSTQPEDGSHAAV